MRVAILGATSQIAKDLISQFVLDPEIKLSLFVRNQLVLNEWLSRFTGAVQVRAKPYAEFEASPSGSFDVVLNFVGTGNPALTASLGRDLWDITQKFDAMAMSYVTRDPACRYIFISSGAVFGGDFVNPITADSVACVQPNNVRIDAWYGLAKLNAEISHRRLENLAIVDVRVFNYFSHSADIQARFLITDILRSIRAGQVFQTSQENVVRDYIGPKDLMQLIVKVLTAPPQNVAIDCFTKAPVDKISLLECMKSEFGLSYALVDQRTGLLATGSKLNYFSKSRKATELFGYSPEEASLDVVVKQSRRLLSLL
jgi:dTDP-4-dehydrorhamnose reductase